MYKSTSQYLVRQYSIVKRSQCLCYVGVCHLLYTVYSDCVCHFLLFQVRKSHNPFQQHKLQYMFHWHTICLIVLEVRCLLQLVRSFQSLCMEAPTDNLNLLYMLMWMRGHCKFIVFKHQRCILLCAYKCLELVTEEL